MLISYVSEYAEFDEIIELSIKNKRKLFIGKHSCCFTVNNYLPVQVVRRKYTS